MSLCTRCGAPFSCGMAESVDGACWCMRLPPLVAVPAAVPVSAAGAAGCWCQACLEQHIAQAEAAASATRAAEGDG